MANANTKKICAIYTRKSSEEGLEQDFNSLHAQREACEAYVLSQRSEGWNASKALYDDGGFSGGSLGRPALTQLISDIKAGLVNIVVVYKIDRLTRSLMDFAKLVDVFDEYGVTFVSVTQSFNTTTSMGRLTLNVLLSFAQFEREVTGERIRDKISASKKKGMWMGGYPPMGYKIKGRTLEIIPEEADIIRQIYKTYLELGNVRKLKHKLDRGGIITRVHISAKGLRSGGKMFSRGKLYRSLNNQVYIGKIAHKGEIYDGQHEPIIDDELFEKVQRKMAEGRSSKTIKKRKSGSLLQGCLYDQDGNVYSPTYTLKSGKRYSYYISQNLIQYRDHPKGIMARIPAHEIEKAITDCIKDWLEKLDMWKQAFHEINEEHLPWLMKSLIPVSNDFIRSVVNKITVSTDNLEIKIDAEDIRKYISTYSKISIGTPSKKEIIIIAPFKTNRGKNGTIIIDSKNGKNKDPFDLPADKLKRIVRGIIWRDEHFAGDPIKNIGRRTSHSENYVNRCIKEGFAFLSQ